MIMKSVTLLFIIVQIAFCVRAQNNFNKESIVIPEDQSLLEFISSVERDSHIRFFYIQEWLEGFVVDKKMNGNSLYEIISQTIDGSELNAVFLYEYAFIFYKDTEKSKARIEALTLATTKKIDIERVTIGSKNTRSKKREVYLTGTINDEKTHAPLTNVSIEMDSKINTQTNALGQFKLALPIGEHVISLRSVGYEEKLVDIVIYDQGEIRIELSELPIMLNEMVISNQSIVERRVGESSIKMLEINRAPTFLGEKDVIKSLQNQTGVTSASEASSGFNVRGGGVDQNLVLYDGVPIFNTSHALGFFTAFNSEVINQVSFYKGGIPAEYGGRVSSVLDMTSKEGDYKTWGGSFGLGLLSVNINVGGPLKQDSSSLILSARSTYSDWMLSLIDKYGNNIQESSVGFFDGSVKYAKKFKDGGKLIFTTYASKDQFQLASDSINSWANIALGLKYGNRFNRYYYSLGAYLGQYSYRVTEDNPETAFSLNYKIIYPSLKLDINRDDNRKQSFGVHFTLYDFEPGKLKPTTSQSNSRSINMVNEVSMESAVYFSETFQFGSRLNLEAGLRLSMYNRIGAGQVFKYQNDAPLEPRNIVDSVQYKPGQLMKTYVGPEPRLAIRYSVGQHSSIKFGYNRMYQYLHLVSNTAVVTPVDIWQSSNTYFKPQVSDQVSLGYFTSSKTNRLVGFLEMFYKKTQNVLDFKDGATLILNSRLETALLVGNGTSYGMEFSIAKTQGRLETEVNYTYSRSLRQVKSRYETEEINEGNKYPSNYDQPHIININWRYSLTRKVFFSGIFTYRTGRPISIPVTAYELNEIPVIDFSDRNNFRLPDYHRLDIALVVEGSNKKKKRIQSHWSLSVYNVYGRKNPYSAFFSYNVSGSVKPQQIALIGVPVPSITYGIKF